MDISMIMPSGHRKYLPIPFGSDGQITPSPKRVTGRNLTTKRHSIANSYLKRPRWLTTTCFLLSFQTATMWSALDMGPPVQLANKTTPREAKPRSRSPAKCTQNILRRYRHIAISLLLILVHTSVSIDFNFTLGFGIFLIVMIYIKGMQRIPLFDHWSDKSQE